VEKRMDISIFEFQADFYKAMGNSMRLQIVHALRDHPKTVTEIMQETGHRQPNVSHHLSVLRGIGIIDSARHGTEILYSLADPKVGEIYDLVRKVLSERMNRRSQIIRE
jgi:DNA-binding transcriptional ArsR family regulator